MKKKYVAIIIAVVVLAIIFTFGQVFTIRSVDVVFENDTDIATDSEIINLAGVEHDKNIFSLNEDKVVEKINNQYKNALKVTVERKFPNKVLIKINERTPMFVLEINNDNYQGFIATDKDFQRTDECQLEDFPDLIKVSGYSIQSTFDTKECRAIREFTNDLINLGVKTEAVNVMISRIYFNGSKMMVQLSQYDAKWEINIQNDIKLQICHIYENYNKMEPIDRLGKIFVYNI
ncbi:MAG: FtsQ-type POTRA domain-containing protein [Clostridia bacterium]